MNFCEGCQKRQQKKQELLMKGNISVQYYPSRAVIAWKYYLDQGNIT